MKVPILQREGNARANLERGTDCIGVTDGGPYIADNVLRFLNFPEAQ